MNLHYSSDRVITVDAFADVLRRSTLGERRPLEDRAALDAMLAHANLLCSAWDGDTLIGVARSLTDFVFCCYLSDLAVDQRYQRQGVGRGLIRQTQARLGPNAKLILLAAPKAVDYYPRLGFEAHPSAWIIPSRQAVP